LKKSTVPILSSKSMMRKTFRSELPKALVIGPMKAGTTWVHSYLDRRGDVILPARSKETFFFDRYWDRGVSWYLSQFKVGDEHGKPSLVEVAPSLFHSVDAPARVREALGDAVTLIVTTRDPVERSWSHYLHLRRYGYTRATLKEAVDLFPEIVSASEYSQTLLRWKTDLPNARFEILPFELLKENTTKYIQNLCIALNLEYRPSINASSLDQNARAIPPSFVLANIARRLSYIARDYHLESMVNIARKLGINKLAYGRGENLSEIKNDQLLIGKDDEDFLYERLQLTCKEYESFI
jgi:hypothetical protein